MFLLVAFTVKELFGLLLLPFEEALDPVLEFTCFSSSNGATAFLAFLPAVSIEFPKSVYVSEPVSASPISIEIAFPKNASDIAEKIDVISSSLFANAVSTGKTTL